MGEFSQSSKRALRTSPVRGSAPTGVMLQRVSALPCHALGEPQASSFKGA
jgi:hypothetical protein